MAGPPSAQDVADALGLTLERENASGTPWCPPGDGIALRRWVSDRSASLGTGIRRAVRLARVMAIANGRDYVRFLYVQLTALRSRHFQYALEEAVAQGRLQRAVATLSGTGIHLREPALLLQAGAHEQFEIDFAQMPRLAALLDFLHNALGFTVVADLLAPLLGQDAPPKHADEVARTLHAALNAWLSPRLESANHILQAQRMRAFLASRGRIAPDAIDDEGILLFWIAMAQAPEDERIDGFRLYRSVAAAMLRYRAALRDAAAARHLEDAMGRGFEPANDFAMDEGATQGEPWRSPLRGLALPPADRVKWFTKKEQRALLNYLGGPAGDAEDEETPDGADSNEVGGWSGGLAGEERFDLSYWLTLLRADVFGAAQASIVARLRKRVPVSEAVAQAMTPVDRVAAYTAAAAIYADLREQLHFESLAALALLAEAGAPEAVFLLEGLGGREAVRAVLGFMMSDASPGEDEEAGEDEESGAEEVRNQIVPALQAALADPDSVRHGPGRKVLLDAATARRKVSRAGFRREDRTDADMIAALRSGAGAVFEVIRELDRLTAVLSQKAPGGDIAADVSRFHDAFQRIYLQQPAGQS
jgi:hypothetical protein